MSDFQSASRQDGSRTAAAAQTVQDKAGEGASLVGGKAAEVGGTAKEQAAQVMGEATAQARDLVGELRTQLTGQAGTQTQRLADNVRRLSDELRELGENGKPDSTMAGVARQIADSGRQVADHVAQRGPDGLVTDLQNFARRRPGVFLAGAALAGFVIARAGKGVGAAASAQTPDDSGAERSADAPAVVAMPPAGPTEPAPAMPQPPAHPPNGAPLRGGSAAPGEGI
ncbi:hypothetical protein [Streptomyces sp. NRRL F-2664]|uniref:hypothetical protein n=1 Tax=Streptomyces sp. NRRL F-2664 TaxID=1463842 RepID=UPI00068A6C57|nr:hypothetical protein [Streptomyces sp. NRRL F-2664]